MSMARQNSLISTCHYKHSPQLPEPLLKTLSKIFQVKTHRNDRCVVGAITFVITVILALSYSGLDIIYTFYDIKSQSTKQTVISGSFVILLTVLWCSFGIYANRLCRRMLSSQSFINSLRLHSKTVFKIPATALVAFMSLVALVINNYMAYHVYQDEGCKKVYLSVYFCRVLVVLRILQSTFSLLFNLCVAFAVLSLCRTHTIGVRRFIRALEGDGIACEAKHRQRFMKQRFSASNNLADLYLPEQCYNNDLPADEDDPVSDSEPCTDRHHLILYRQEHAAIETISNEYNPVTDGATKVADAPDSRILSKDDILFSYWKLTSRMRMTSKLLQRWMAFWICFLLLWLLRWILIWLTKPASYMEIAQFVLPLLIIIILCTAYGEANTECSRIVSSITPLQDRLDIIKTLPNIQIGMTIFSYPLQYGSVATVVAALSIALSSRLILDEFLPAS